MAVDEIVLRLSNLHKSVANGTGELGILHDISLSVTAGESLAIVGASGSGKSTLLSLMAGLDSPSHGSIELCGLRLETLDEDGRAQVRAGRVGFVFQSFQLLPNMTAIENIALPLELMGTHPHVALQQANAWLAKVGLTARGQHYPNQLSGGEQQRVALARAFAPEPQLVFADEPTGNLDLTTGKQITEQMFALNQQSKTTLILVTHDLEIAACCQRVFRLESGKLIKEEAQ